VRPSLWDAPRGVCAPVLGTACEHLCLTTVARWVGRLFVAVGPTALIRDVAHVAHDAARFAAGGVRRVEIRCYRVADADAIAAAMTNVGITARIVSDAMLLRPGAAESLALHRAERETGEHGDVPGPLVFEATEPAVEAVSTASAVPSQPPEPAPPPQPAPPVSDLPTAGPTAGLPTAGPLTLLRHDAQTETAVFQHGDATYTVQVPLGGRTTLSVTLAVGTTQHRDRFDVAVAPQRLRFAAAAGRRVQRTPALIAADLETLLPLLLALNDPAPAPAATSTSSSSSMTEADHAAALTLLRSPDLLKNLLADLDALGWVGEDDAKRLCLLAAISRFSDEPVWAALTCEEAGERFPGLGIIAAITPPEHVVRLSRLTDSALFHGGPDALTHKLLILDDVAGIGTAAATALRVLRSRGVLTTPQVERDSLRGGMRTRLIETRGPLAVVTATSGGIPQTLSAQFVEVALDESSAHAQRMLAARQCARTPAETLRLTTRWIAAQRLLRPLPVSLPSDLSIPAAISTNRALHAPFIGFVTASALLHQYQRPHLDGRLIATAADVDLARHAIESLMSQAVDGLTARARIAVTALSGLSATTFTLADLRRILPDWSRGTACRAVEDLLAADCVVTLRRRSGVRAEYQLVPSPGARADLLTCSPPAQPTWAGSTREVANG
jgi:hypothetical protein